MPPAVPILVGIAAVVGAVAATTSAVAGIVSAVKEEERAEETAAAEEEYRQEQRDLAIAEKEAEVQSLQEQAASLGGQSLYEYGRIGKAGYETVGTQRAGFAVGGAELGAGSPLQVMTGTLKQTQEDVAYKQSWYAAEMGRIQAEIVGVQEQLGILRSNTEVALPSSLLGSPSTLPSPIKTMNMFRGGFAGMR
jgi:hypothetical protein